MSEHMAGTETIDLVDAEPRLDDMVARVQRSGTRIRVESDGTLVAAIVSSDDLRRLDKLDAERAARFKVIDEMRVAFQDVSPEELEREANRALALVRAEMRSERERAAANNR